MTLKLLGNRWEFWAKAIAVKRKIDGNGAVTGQCRDGKYIQVVGGQGQNKSMRFYALTEEALCRWMPAHYLSNLACDYVPSSPRVPERGPEGLLGCLSGSGITPPPLHRCANPVR